MIKINFNNTLKATAYYGVLTVILLSLSQFAFALKTANIPISNRTKYNFNFDWKFTKSDPANADKVNFDDSTWETISAPHTFNDDDTFDDYMVGNHVGEANQWRGTVWYRKYFKLDSKSADKKVFVEFESVRQIVDIYINGKYLGTNRNGFIPFGYDLTPYLNFGNKENIIALKVNNDRNEKFNQNAPFTWNHEHWHPTHGGIYRNVYLYSLDKVHITLPLYDNLKTTGNYVYSDNISATSADVFVETEVKNDYKNKQDVVFEASVIDNQGKVVAVFQDKKSLSAGKKLVFKGNVNIKNPNLWFTRHPYLYTLISTIKIANKVIDVTETPFGIRSFDFNKDTGFWLNKEHVKLHGWGQKPTNEWAGLGAALPNWLGEFTYKLMDEAGGNFIRWGHCAGSPSDISMGDKYGFVTLMPGVSGESENTGEGWEVRVAAFKDMVIYYRNHPSIFIYEGGNWAVSAEHFEELTAIIKEYDPHGKRLLGNRRAEVNAKAKNYVTMEVGTEGWKREFPNLPIVESEYMRDEGPRRVWDDYSLPAYGKYPRKEMNQYKWTSQQYAALQVSHWWLKMGVKPYHAGGANWLFSDGTSGGRNPSEVTRASGEVDGVRLPKEAFYALKSMWRSEPQVHVIGHWTYDPGVKKDIYVVSNCAMVKLYVNNQLIGTNANPENAYLFKFPNVAYQAGEIKVVGFIDGKEKVSQQKITVGNKKSIKLTAIKGPNGWRADGSDVVLVDVEIVDSLGRRCPTNQQDINFTFSGEGEWRGGYNSNTPENTGKLKLYTEAGINRVSIRSTRNSGSVQITATAEGLLPATVVIKSEKVAILNGLSTELPQIYEEQLGAAEPQEMPQLGNSQEFGSNVINAKVIAFSPEKRDLPAINAIDKIAGTFWEVSTKKEPQFIELDLGTPQLINKLNILTEEKSIFTYQVEAKLTLADNYKTVLVVKETEGKILSNRNDIANVSARYVKVTISSVKKPDPLKISEILLYGEMVKQESTILKNFSYTGEGTALLKINLQNGNNIYTDKPFVYSYLPNYLLGAEYVQTPDADKIYWARDQLQFLAGDDIVVYIAHDDRVILPEFISAAYTKTADIIMINGVSHRVFKREVSKNSEVIMAGNVDKNSSQNANMYVVFVKKIAK
jgi:beta-galactosidase